VPTPRLIYLNANVTYYLAWSIRTGHEKVAPWESEAKPLPTVRIRGSDTPDICIDP
jgi:hypothetical protein